METKPKIPMHEREVNLVKISVNVNLVSKVKINRASFIAWERRKRKREL